MFSLAELLEQFFIQNSLIQRVFFRQLGNICHKNIVSQTSIKVISAAMILMMIIKLNEEWRGEARWETLLIFPKRFGSGETYRQLFLPLSLPLCLPSNTLPPLSVVLLRLSFRNTSPELGSSCYTSGLFQWKSRKKPKKVLKSITLLFVQIQIVFRFYWKTFALYCVKVGKSQEIYSSFYSFFLPTLEQSNVHENKKQGERKNMSNLFPFCVTNYLTDESTQNRKNVNPEKFHGYSCALVHKWQWKVGD